VNCINAENYINVIRRKNLLDKDPSEIIAHNFGGSTAELFQNEWINKNREKKGCRYSDEIKKFAVTLHYYSPKAYNYCRYISQIIICIYKSFNYY